MLSGNNFFSFDSGIVTCIKTKLIVNWLLWNMIDTYMGVIILLSTFKENRYLKISGKEAGWETRVTLIDNIIIRMNKNLSNSQRIC